MIPGAFADRRRPHRNFGERAPVSQNRGYWLHAGHHASCDLAWAVGAVGNSRSTRNRILVEFAQVSQTKGYWREGLDGYWWVLVGIGAHWGWRFLDAKGYLPGRSKRFIILGGKRPPTRRPSPPARAHTRRPVLEFYRRVGLLLRFSAVIALVAFVGVVVACACVREAGVSAVTR